MGEVMESLPAVSIIVPVYKVEAYLRTCIESILNQSYINFELILIDDGSPDKCGDICESYRYDERVIVIHKQNGGLSDARNTGIDIARGKYITFIDSDDYVSKGYLEILVDTMEKYDADIVQCNETSNEHAYDEMVFPDSSKGVKVVKGYSDILKNYLCFKDIGVCAQEKLYKIDLFESIRFPVGRINEDTCTTYKLLYKTNTYVCIHTNLYFYRLREDSIMHGNFSEKRFQILQVPDEIRGFLGKEVEQFGEFIDYYEMRIFVRLYNQLIRSSNIGLFEAELESMREHICRTKSNMLFEKKYKLILFFIKFCPSLYAVIIKLFKVR